MQERKPDRPAEAAFDEQTMLEVLNGLVKEHPDQIQTLQLGSTEYRYASPAISTISINGKPKGILEIRRTVGEEEYRYAILTQPYFHELIDMLLVSDGYVDSEIYYASKPTAHRSTTAAINNANKDVSGESLLKTVEIEGKEWIMFKEIDVREKQLDQLKEGWMRREAHVVYINEKAYMMLSKEAENQPGILGTPLFVIDLNEINNPSISAFTLTRSNKLFLQRILQNGGYISLHMAQKAVGSPIEKRRLLDKVRDWTSRTNIELSKGGGEAIIESGYAGSPSYVGWFFLKGLDKKTTFNHALSELMKTTDFSSNPDVAHLSIEDGDLYLIPDLSAKEVNFDHHMLIIQKKDGRCIARYLTNRHFKAIQAYFAENASRKLGTASYQVNALIGADLLFTQLPYEVDKRILRNKHVAEELQNRSQLAPIPGTVMAQLDTILSTKEGKETKEVETQTIQIGAFKVDLKTEGEKQWLDVLVKGEAIQIYITDGERALLLKVNKNTPLEKGDETERGYYLHRVLNKVFRAIDTTRLPTQKQFGILEENLTSVDVERPKYSPKASLDAAENTLRDERQRRNIDSMTVERFKKFADDFGIMQGNIFNEIAANIGKTFNDGTDLELLRKFKLLDNGEAREALRSQALKLIPYHINTNFYINLFKSLKAQEAKQTFFNNLMEQAYLAVEEALKDVAVDTEYTFSAFASAKITQAMRKCADKF